MDPTNFVLAVFAFVYAGMLLGGIPGLALDRTGIALLGAIALVVAGRLTPADAWSAVDVPTLALLLALMVVSSQLRLGGFYTRISRRLAAAAVSPDVLLALLVGAAGLLSAVLANDIVVLAMTPIWIEGCARRGLDPRPFLLALACAANVGSAATLIGNPQNMLVGQALHMDFARYLALAGPPTLAGLALVWLVVRTTFRARWAAPPFEVAVDAPAFDRWQTTKGLAVVAALMAAFLFIDWPREVVALGAAGLLMTSRRMHSRAMLGLVDWQLLVLFVGLFVVNHAISSSGLTERFMVTLRDVGVDPSAPPWLFALAVALSNLVSNVPATMLLLPAATTETHGAILALASTLAGNLLLVGSIANLIVVDQAARMGVHIGWAAHARIGVPVTLLTLAVTAAWLGLQI